MKVTNECQRVNQKLQNNQAVSSQVIIRQNASQSFIYAIETLGQEEALEVLKAALKDYKKQMKKVG